MLGRWEWIIIEIVVLGFLLAELASVRRSMAKDQAKAQGEHQPRD